MPEMMKCGCAANAVQTMPDGSRIPSCVIHDCSEIAASVPDLSTRRARCSYFGRSIRPMGVRGGNECGTCRDKQACGCERPSSADLAFFSHTPDKPFDQFYCGCKGWD